MLDVRQVPAEGPLSEAVAGGMNVCAKVLGAASLEGLKLMMMLLLALRESIFVVETSIYLRWLLILLVHERALHVVLVEGIRVREKLTERYLVMCECLCVISIVC